MNERTVRTFRMSAAEWDRVRSAADGESPATWVRRIALEECGRVEAERRRGEAEREERRRLVDSTQGYF